MDRPVFSRQKCEPCEGGISPLTKEEAKGFLVDLQGGFESPPGTSSRLSWEIVEEGKSIEKVFAFETKSVWPENYQDGADFIRQIVEIAQQENHHPTTISLQTRRKGAHVHVKFSTHAIGGLSKNDFMMAARLNNLFERWDGNP